MMLAGRGAGCNPPAGKTTIAGRILPHGRSSQVRGVFALGSPEQVVTRRLIFCIPVYPAVA